MWGLTERRECSWRTGWTGWPTKISRMTSLDFFLVKIPTVACICDVVSVSLMWPYEVCDLWASRLYVTFISDLWPAMLYTASCFNDYKYSILLKENPRINKTLWSLYFSKPFENNLERNQKRHRHSESGTVYANNKINIPQSLPPPQHPHPQPHLNFKIFGPSSFCGNLYCQAQFQQAIAAAIELR